MNHWLVKSEPFKYSWERFLKHKRTYWDGVRNFQARNNLKAMKKGDEVLFYHSNAEPPGIAGIAEVVRGGYPDPSAFLEGDVPVWYSVDVRFVKKFKDILPLEKLRSVKGLETMLLLKRGQRLSVQPVTEKEWAVILKLAEK